MDEVRDPNVRPDPDPETAEEAFALARRIASNAVARAVVRGEFGQGRLRAAAATLAQVLHRAAERPEGALAESIAEATRHLDVAAATLARVPQATVFGDGVQRATTSLTAALAALNCARALADGTLCAGCAKVARHPGEGYACAAHPTATPEDDSPFGRANVRGHLVDLGVDASKVEAWLDDPEGALGHLPPASQKAATLRAFIRDKPADRASFFARIRSAIRSVLPPGAEASGALTVRWPAVLEDVVLTAEVGK